MSAAADVALDYRTAFDLAPIGLVLSRQRLIVDCNRKLLEMFGATREQLVGRASSCCTRPPTSSSAPASASSPAWTRRAGTPTSG